MQTLRQSFLKFLYSSRDGSQPSPQRYMLLPTSTDSSIQHTRRKISTLFRDDPSPEPKPATAARIFKSLVWSRRTLIGLLACACIAAGIVGIGILTAPDNAPGVLLDDVDSDITVLYNNDLYGRVSTNTDAALLLSKPMSAISANAKCKLLGERLFTLSDAHAAALLAYPLYLNSSSTDTLHWLRYTVENPEICQAIDSVGNVSLQDCSRELRTLCTYSAPMPDVSDVEDAQKWRIQVRTGNGTMNGFRDRRGFRFMGIRYAPKPTRFAYSTSYEAQDRANALRVQSECTQSGGIGSEDCLFLNIWTPYLPGARRQTSPDAFALKPVIFWIHGGAFVSGSGSQSMFDGGNLASRGDLVVVTFNYRLGTLGFLAIDDGSTTGNWALSDQVNALEWVNRHVESFGGDPRNITIVGQSAGAASVRFMLGSPKTQGLFSAAIMQSNLGGYDFAESYSSYYNVSTEMAEYASPILKSTGCAKAKDRVGCLRTKSDRTIANLGTQASFITIDNNFIMADRLILNGTADPPPANVPVIMGTMQDDAVLFISDPFTSNLTTSVAGFSFNTSITNHTDDFPIPPIETQSPATNQSAVYNTTVRAATDAMFRCVDYATAYAGAQNSIFPSIYYYEFARGYGHNPSRPQCNPPVSDAYPFGDPSMPYYKCHSNDLWYVFGNMAWLKIPDRDGLDIPFSQFVVDQWAAFAWHHDPNPRPEYLEARGFTRSLDMVKEAGPWRPLRRGDGGQDLRIMRAKNAEQTPFGETQQCKDLGLGLDHFA